MKKYILGLGAAVLVLISGTSPVLAKDDAFTKFGRGVANIVTAPGELYTQPWLLSKDHATSVAICGGILKGAALIVAREVVGVYEVLTFPFPIPKDYRPIIKPVTPFTDWDTRQP